MRLNVSVRSLDPIAPTPDRAIFSVNKRSAGPLGEFAKHLFCEPQIDRQPEASIWGESASYFETDCWTWRRQRLVVDFEMPSASAASFTDSPLTA